MYVSGLQLRIALLGFTLFTVRRGGVLRLSAMFGNREVERA